MVGGIGTHMVTWAHRVAPKAASEVKLKQRLYSICIDRYNADDLMKPHGSVRVVKIWCGIRTDHVLR
jgi:hypothetical protein